MKTNLWGCLAAIFLSVFVAGCDMASNGQDGVAAGISTTGAGTSPVVKASFTRGVGGAGIKVTYSIESIPSGPLLAVGVYEYHPTTPSRVRELSSISGSTTFSTTDLANIPGGLNSITLGLAYMAPGNRPVWYYRWIGFAASVRSRSELVTGNTLYPWEYLSATYGQSYRVVMQNDGNLVVYYVDSWNKYTPIWSSGTQGNPGAWAVLQNDGNFVIYSASGKALWAISSYTSRRGNKLVMQDDGNLVLYCNSEVVWSSKHGGY